MEVMAHRRSLDSMRRFYDRFTRLYPVVEKSLTPALSEIVDAWIAPLPGLREKTAVEYACGTGSLSLLLSRHYRSVDGRDLSHVMLRRARRRAARAGVDVTFTPGDIRSIREPDKSFDHAFMSFALHLFPPDRIEAILSRLLSVARELVVIIDHVRVWKPVTALLEWIEGGWYDRFLTLDFRAIAGRIGAVSFTERETRDASVMFFSPPLAPPPPR